MRSTIIQLALHECEEFCGSLSSGTMQIKGHFSATVAAFFVHNFFFLCMFCWVPFVKSIVHIRPTFWYSKKNENGNWNYKVFHNFQSNIFFFFYFNSSKLLRLNVPYISRPWMVEMNRQSCVMHFEWFLSGDGGKMLSSNYLTIKVYSNRFQSNQFGTVANVTRFNSELVYTTYHKNDLKLESLQYTTNSIYGSEKGNAKNNSNTWHDIYALIPLKLFTQFRMELFLRIPLSIVRRFSALVSIIRISMNHYRSQITAVNKVDCHFDLTKAKPSTRVEFTMYVIIRQ